MKWGEYGNLGDPSEEMLQLILHQITKGEIRVASATGDYGFWLNGFFRPGGGAGGDPVFEINHIPAEGGYGSFEAYCEVEPVGKVIFSGEHVMDALEKIFAAYSVKYPEERNVVQNIR